MTAQIDIYGLADATRRRANGMGNASSADGAILSRVDLSTAVRGRPDLKVRKRNSAKVQMRAVERHLSNFFSHAPSLLSFSRLAG